MTDIGSSPRVNAATLAQYAGKLVRVVGKVVQQQNGTGVLQTSDVKDHNFKNDLFKKNKTNKRLMI